jgi:Helix-turn-helix domain
MSRKERKRLAIMAGVKRDELTLVQAAGLTSLSYRQVKRVWRRYQDQGDVGLVHRLRGRASARRLVPELRARILARVEARYPGFRSHFGG